MLPRFDLGTDRIQHITAGDGSVRTKESEAHLLGSATFLPTRPTDTDRPLGASGVVNNATSCAAWVVGRPAPSKPKTRGRRAGRTQAQGKPRYSAAIRHRERADVRTQPRVTLANCRPPVACGEGGDGEITPYTVYCSHFHFQVTSVCIFVMSGIVQPLLLREKRRTWSVMDVSWWW